jgi:hypothetical protein
MTQQQKVLLLVLGGATVLGGVGWYFYSQQKKRTIGVSQQRAIELAREQFRVGPGEIVAARQQIDPSIREGVAAATQRLFAPQG